MCAFYAEKILSRETRRAKVRIIPENIPDERNHVAQSELLHEQGLHAGFGYVALLLDVICGNAMIVIDLKSFAAEITEKALIELLCSELFNSTF